MLLSVPVACLYPADEYNSNGANIAKAVQMLGGADAAGTPLWWDAKDHSVENSSIAHLQEPFLIHKIMKYKSIFNVCLLTAFLLTATTSCDDWTEMEIHETDVNGAKEQNPEQYAVYTQNLRAYKATKHTVVYARLDNAPDKATSEKFFLRSLPDSIDIVSMRNADRLTDFDREDMAMVRAGLRDESALLCGLHAGRQTE